MARYFVPAGAGFLKMFGPIEPGTAAVQVSSVDGGAVLDDRVAVRTGRSHDKGLGALAAVLLEEVNARHGLRARALLAAADTDRQRRQRVTRRLILHLAPVEVGARVDRGHVLLGDAGESAARSARARRRSARSPSTSPALRAHPQPARRRARRRPSFRHDAWPVRDRKRRDRSHAFTMWPVPPSVTSE